MPVTMKDVAKKAGVSIKTVSRVINNQGEISEETRQRIMQIVDELGYRPNTLARGLLTGKTYTVGVIIPDITDPFFPDLILGAEQAARSRDFNVFLCNANREPELELHYANVLKDRRVDGLILAGSRLQPEGLKSIVESQHTVIMSQYAIDGAAVFSMNDFDASYSVGEYLCSLGHREVAYFNGGWTGSREHRMEGFIQAFVNHGVSRDVVTIARTSPVIGDTSVQAAKELLISHPNITAVACYNDVLAIAMIQAAHELGKHIPEDLSVVGYDDIPESARTMPPLTTIHYDRFEIGNDMMTCLLDLIEEKSNLPPNQTPIDGKLLKRQSCTSLT